MTIKEIKKEANDSRLAAYRFKAMPAYCVAFFVVFNILILSAVVYAFLSATVEINLLVKIIIICYCAVLLLLALCLSGQFSYSIDEYFLSAVENEKADTHFTFGGYSKNNFVRTMLARLLGFFVTLVLTCLVIVPGVIFAVKTSMTNLVMKKNPQTDVAHAMRISSKIMRKHSMQYLRLGFSFLGWFLLCILTLGLGFIFVLPYFNCCKTIFYKKVLSGESVEEIPAESAGGTEAVLDDQPIAEEYIQEEPIAAEPVVEDVIIESDVPMGDVVIEPAEPEPEIPVIVPDTSEPITEAADAEPVIASGPVEIKESAEPQVEEIKVEPKPEPEPDEPAKPAEAPPAAESDPHSRDAIKQRIEQLKKERNAHIGSARPQRPVAHEKPSHAAKEAATQHGASEKQPPLQKPAHAEPAKPDAPKRAKKSDEFAPEIIDVEIVED